jgi:hypothetical protein
MEIHVYLFYDIYIDRLLYRKKCNRYLKVLNTVNTMHDIIHNLMKLNPKIGYIFNY